MKVLITGGTGRLGRELAAVDRSGTVLRLQSRRPRPPDTDAALEWAQADLATGEGLAEALAGVDAVIHAATDSRAPDVADVEGTRRLVDAAARAGVSHLIYVSIVGVDAIPHPYYRRKLVAERLVAGGAVPHSILRATQFHSFLEPMIARAARLPLVILLPVELRFQPVAASEVALRLLGAVAEGPRGRLVDFAGPEVLTMRQAAEAWREIRGVRKAVVRIPYPGKVAAAFRAGKATAPDGERGTTRWRDWLVARVAREERKSP